MLDLDPDGLIGLGSFLIGLHRLRPQRVDRLLEGFQPLIDCVRLCLLKTQGVPFGACLRKFALGASQLGGSVGRCLQCLGLAGGGVVLGLGKRCGALATTDVAADQQSDNQAREHPCENEDRREHGHGASLLPCDPANGR